MASRRTALGSAALLLPLLAPAAASAVTVAPSVPCVRYVATSPPATTLGLSTVGWAPMAPLTFKVDGQTVGTGAADAAGAFNNAAAPFTPPAPKGNLQSVTLTADDGATVATSPMKIVRLIVTVPSKAKPSKRVKYRAFGFQPGKRLYLFVRRGGKTKGRFTLGKPTGECGTLTKKLRYMPLKSWSTGLYDFWYSQTKTYSQATRIYGYRIRIFKTFS